MRGLSFAIPTHNRAELLLQAVNSVFDLVTPNGWSLELIIVDNASTDNTEQIVQQLISTKTAPLNVRLVKELEVGLSIARNRAVHEAKYECVAFLDDDMIVAPSWIEGFVEAIEQFERATELDPRFAMAWYNLGGSYYLAGALEDARNVAVKLKALSPNLAQQLETLVSE